MRKIISKILVIVLVIEALALNGTLALGNELTENIGDIAEIETAVENDAVATPSAIENTSIAEIAENIVDGYSMYSELNSQEKYILTSNLGVREDTMSALCESGFGIRESLKKAIIMQQLNSNVSDILNMINIFGDENIAAAEAASLRMYQLKSELLENEEEYAQLTALLLSGHYTEEAVNIYAASKCMGVIPQDIVETSSAIGFESESYIPGVINYVVDNYISTNNITLDDFYTLISEFIAENKLTTAAVYASSDEEDEIFDYNHQYGMFNYTTGINDSVNMSTGSLTYTDNIATIPGKNGLDLNLSLTYDSSVRLATSRKSNPKYLWKFNFTRFDVIAGDSYLFIPGKGSYPIKYKNDKWNILNYGYKDIELKPVVNNEYEGAHLVLEYTNGRKDYFDSYGRIMAMLDRYGNKITFEYSSSSNDSCIIKMTNGKQVTINYEVPNSTSTSSSYEMVITIPQSTGKDRVITYKMAKIESSSYIYSKIETDDNGNDLVTNFYYNMPKDNYAMKLGSSDIKFTEVNLTKVTYPTGIIAHYEYETAPYFYRETQTKNYSRIIRKGYEYDGKMHKNETYTYSEENYTGYPTRGDADSTIPSSFQYSTTVKYGNGSKKECSYNCRGTLGVETVYGDGTHRSIGYRYETEKNLYGQYYDKYKPVQVICTDGDLYKYIKYETYSYDMYGRLASSWDSHYTGIPKNADDNTINRTLYSYGNYDLPLLKQYYKDENTLITERNTISGLSITMSELIENSQLKGKTIYAYDNYGNVIQQKDYIDSSKAVITDTTYVNNNTYIGSITKDGITNIYTYDNVGNVLSTTDGNGNTTSFEYDKFGNIIKTTNPDSSVTQASYDYIANKATYTDENGNAKSYEYDPAGNLINVIDCKTKSVLSSYAYYDYNFKVKSKTMGDESKTTYYYDYLDRYCGYEVTPVNSSTVLYKETITRSYTAEYEQITKKNNDCSDSSIISTQYYDRLGNMIESNENNRTIKYTYDLIGNPLSAYYTDRNAYEYYTTDAIGNILTLKDRAGNTTTYTYDWLGRTMAITDPKGGWQKYTYDGNNQVLSERIAFGNVSDSYSEKLYAYDANGNLTQTKVKNSPVSGSITYSITNNAYDSRNNLIKTSIVDNDNKTYYTEYEYDKTGNNTKVKAANGQNITTYTYNQLNRITAMKDPMGMRETYTYDLSGNMISKKDRNGTTLNFTYDALGRLLKESAVVGGSEVVKSQTSYTNYNLLKTETNENGTITTTFNKYGNPVSQQIAQNGNYYKINYAYTNGELLRNKWIYKTNQYWDSQSILGDYYYYYDNMDRIITFNEAKSDYSGYQTVAWYSYDVNSNLTKTTYANGTTAEYSYNYANLVTSMKNKKGSTVLSSYNYTYNYDGNQASKTDHNGNISTYTYDNLGRLKTENSTAYSYDYAGNRIQETYEDTVIDYVYDKNNRLIREDYFFTSSESRTITYYNYDNNGNQISKVKSKVIDEGSIGNPYLKILTDAEVKSSNETYTRLEYYKYNVFNQLTGYSNSKGTQASYAYLPNGLRSSKTVGGITTGQVWDGQNLLLETNSNGDVSNFYEYGLDLVRNKTNSTYYNYNAHGDVVQLTNSSGTVVCDYTYDAFGNGSYTGSVTSPFRYCGEYRDNETGLIYLRNRYYNPSTGRFINEDPIRSGGNWYSYCSNNPILLIDPFGLFDEDTRLSLGSSGDDVKVLQYELQNRGFMSKNMSDEEGYFGEQTRQAVNNYKDYYGLGNTGANAGVVGKQTWEKLGLIYRTKQDIDAGVEIVTIGYKQYFDVSVPFNNLVISATEEARKNATEDYTKNLIWFSSKVNHGMAWDIKRKGPWIASMKCTYPGDTRSEIVLFGEIYTPEKLGNILYGYVGTELCINEPTLIFGSICASGIQNYLFSKELRDNENKDHPDIREGINWKINGRLK